ncbi:MAG: flavin monoamine oxidase family protein [Dehalococcoidia bacterium]
MTQDNESKQLDTVIVGGGLAGLTAGYLLRNRDILLLEKEDICGGRTISQELGEYVYNTGAQVILGDTSLVARLADELGVRRTLIAKTKIPMYIRERLITSSSEAGFIWQLPLPLAEKVKLGLKIYSLRRRFRSLIHETLNPQDPRILQLNSVTLEELVRSRHPDVNAIWDILAISSTALPANEVTAYYPLKAFLHFLDDEYYVEGGTGSLARALYHRIADKTETGAEVLEIAHEDGKVGVTYERDGQRRTVRSWRCVVAVPGPLVLSTVKDLPSWKREALSRVEFRPGTSAAFLLSEPTENFLGEGVWRVPVVGRRFCSMTNPTFTFPREMKERAGGLIRVFAVGGESRELMNRSDGEALEMLTDDLISTFPNMKGKMKASAIKHWEYALVPWRPGRLEVTSAIQAPTGNIHYCGDYTVSAGMEAAVLSAYRAVESIQKEPVL